MPLIDQSLTWRLAEERLETETDPVLRRNLELLIQHQKAEATLDMERLMATVSENARYEFFGSGQEPIVGKAAVQKFYEDFAASGAQKLQLDTQRLIVDRHCILTEGLMRMAYPGATLAARGLKIDDLDADYLFETHMAIVWPIDPDDGLFVGEDSYTGGDGFAGIEHRKIDPAAITLFEPAPA